MYFPTSHHHQSPKYAVTTWLHMCWLTICRSSPSSSPPRIPQLLALCLPVSKLLSDERPSYHVADVTISVCDHATPHNLFKCGDLQFDKFVEIGNARLLLTEWNGAFKLTGVLSLSWSICKEAASLPWASIWLVSMTTYRVRTFCSLPLLARQELFTLLDFTSLCLFVISMLRVQIGEQGRQSRAVEVALWPLPFLPVSHLCPLISRH